MLPPDATVETINISQRVETDDSAPVWCLDTEIRFDIRYKENTYDRYLEIEKNAFPDYLAEPHPDPLFIPDVSDMTCTYQTNNATKHIFDDVEV